MSPEYEGTEIKQAPLMILQLLARRVDDDDNNKVLVRDMMDETNLSRGSIYNYLNNTLAPLDLAGIVGTKSTPGAASDAKFWGITQEGYEWVTSLGPDDLAPAEASGEAVRRAEQAVEIANDARATAEGQADSLNEEISKIRTNADTAFTTQKRDIDRLEDNLDELRESAKQIQAVANEPNQALAREIRRLDQDIDQLYSDLWALDTDLLGDPNDENDPGTIGMHRESIETINEAYETQQQRIRLLTGIAIGAVILAVIAIGVALL